MDLGTEMIQQSKLAAFIRRLEDRDFHSVGLSESVGEPGVELSAAIEKADVLRFFPRLDDDLLRSSVEPSLAEVDQLVGDLLGKSAAVLVADLELNLEAARRRERGDLSRIQLVGNETLARFDAVDAD